MNLDPLKKYSAYLIKYALSSLLGVAFDFGIYTALVHSGLLPPGLANAVSTPVAFLAGWFIAGKTIFRSYAIKNRGYLTWAAYMLFVIVVYSIAIQSLVWLGLDKYIAKIFMTGISFCTNSIFFKYVILKKFSGATVCG